MFNEFICYCFELQSVLINLSFFVISQSIYMYNFICLGPIGIFSITLWFGVMIIAWLCMYCRILKSCPSVGKMRVKVIKQQEHHPLNQHHCL